MRDFPMPTRRGVRGGVLPPEFWTENEHGVMGGVEQAFMSTTTSREVAEGFARGGTGNVAMLFKIRMGMIDRGASISFLSQFPVEQEILFPPLTGMEVVSQPVAERGMIVVELRLSCNLHDLPISEVIAKMQRSNLGLLDIIQENFKFAGAPERALAPLRALRQEAEKRPGAWFNSAANFKLATSQARHAGQWGSSAGAGWGPHFQSYLGAAVPASNRAACLAGRRSRPRNSRDLAIESQCRTRRPMR